MKQLWLPLLCDKDSFVASGSGGSFITGVDAVKAFFSEEKAKEFAKDLSLRNPGGKVLMFKAIGLIEPRKIEFAEKIYNDGGELIV